MSQTLIPLQEVDLSTRRLRLHYVTRLNAQRLDYDLSGLMAEMDTLPPGERAAMRVLFVAAKKFLGVDMRQHPSALLLLLLHVLDDTTFDAIAGTYGQLIAWAFNGHDSAATAAPGQTRRRGRPAKGQEVQPGRAAGPQSPGGGDDGIGQDHVLPLHADAGVGQAPDSNFGHEAR